MDDARATASDRLSRARRCDARRSRAVAVSLSRAAASALRHRAWLDPDQTWPLRAGRKLVDGRRSNDCRRRSSRAVRAVPRLQALVAARDHRLGDDTRPDRYADGVPSSQVAAAVVELSPRSRLGGPAGVEHPAASEVGPRQRLEPRPARLLRNTTPGPQTARTGSSRAASLTPATETLTAGRAVRQRAASPPRGRPRPPSGSATRSSRRTRGRRRRKPRGGRQRGPRLR
jgi:hypothetical protein